MGERLLDRYELMGLLGAGAMGSVYKAYDHRDHRAVALKVLNAQLGIGPAVMERLLREAAALSSLHHENIVKLYGAEQLHGNACLVLELVEGRTLDVVIRKHESYTVPAKLHYMSTVCHALHYAHERGLVHRDLKPSNLMVQSGMRPKIIDFGIVRMANSKLTGSAKIGTVEYMSPEQLEGREVDRQTDIFSAGVVLYELLTGISPFGAESTTATMRKLLHDPIPLPTEIPSAPASLNYILSRSMARERSRRFATAEEMGKALADCASGRPIAGASLVSPGPLLPDPPPPAPPPSPEPSPPPPPPPSRTKRRFGIGSGVLSLVLLAARIIATIMGQDHSVKIGNKDHVFYTGSATEQDAKALGNQLKAEQYFTDTGHDVFLDKSGDGTTVSFVIKDGVAGDTKTIEEFEEVGRLIAPSVGGFPVRIRLIDKDKNEKAHTIVQKYLYNTHDAVLYTGDATEADAHSLAEALHSQDYFSDKGADVFLSKHSGETLVTFIVKTGTWNSPENVLAFDNLGRQVAPSVGGFPIKIRLTDEPQNTGLESAIGKVALEGNAAVFYYGSATEAEANALANKLKADNYFDGKEYWVFLAKHPSGTSISFIVPTEQADKLTTKVYYNVLVRSAASEVGGLPIELRLVDQRLNLLDSSNVE